MWLLTGACSWQVSGTFRNAASKQAQVYLYEDCQEKASTAMGEAVPGVTIRQAGEVSVTLERNQQAVVLWKSDDEF